MDRHGRKAFYPLLSLSIGSVRLQDFSGIMTEADLAECASKAKSMAKQINRNKPIINWAIRSALVVRKWILPAVVSK